MLERLVGGEHPDIAPVLHDLGNAHAALGNQAAGDRLEQRARTIREREMGVPR